MDLNSFTFFNALEKSRINNSNNNNREWNWKERRADEVRSRGGGA